MVKMIGINDNPLDYYVISHKEELIEISILATMLYPFVTWMMDDAIGVRLILYQLSLPIAHIILPCTSTSASTSDYPDCIHLTKATLHYTQPFHKHKTHSYSTTTTPSPTNALGIRYIPIEDAENLEQYCPEGYHPTSIGDHIHNRYDIIYKLGFGGYSTS